MEKQGERYENQDEVAVGQAQQETKGLGELHGTNLEGATV
jgi:hypothetical protein